MPQSGQVIFFQNIVSNESGMKNLAAWQAIGLERLKRKNYRPKTDFDDFLAIAGLSAKK